MNEQPVQETKGVRRCTSCGSTTNPFYDAKIKQCYCKICVREMNREQIGERRRKMKLRAVEYKGGKCCICGYSRCMDALSFHHVDSTTKSKKLNSYQDGSKTKTGGAGCGVQSVTAFSADWNLVKEELDKCILVCACCHKEIEAGFLTLESEQDDRTNI